MMKKIVLSLAVCVLASPAAFSGLTQGPGGRPGVSCPGCAPGVVNLMLQSAFQATDIDRNRMMPVFQNLAQWLNTDAGRSFLKADPSWKALSQMSFKKRGTVEGVTSMVLVSPLIEAAGPKWENNKIARNTLIGKLMSSINDLSRDPKNDQKRDDLFKLLGMLREEAHGAVSGDVWIWIHGYLSQDLPQDREALKSMLWDVKAVQGFLTQVKLYSYSDHPKLQIERAIKAVAQRKKDVEAILSKDLLAKAGRIAKDLGTGKEDPVEAKDSGQAADRPRLKPSGRPKKLDMRNFSITRELAFTGGPKVGTTYGVGIYFEGNYSYEGPGGRAMVPGKVYVHGNFPGGVQDPDWRSKLPDPPNVFYVALGGYQSDGPRIERRPMTPSEIAGFLESLEKHVREYEERARLRGEKPDDYTRKRDAMVQIRIAAREQMGWPGPQ